MARSVTSRNLWMHGTRCPVANFPASTHVDSPLPAPTKPLAAQTLNAKCKASVIGGPGSDIRNLS
jgi:hypothetical protein